MNKWHHKRAVLPLEPEKDGIGKFVMQEHTHQQMNALKTELKRRNLCYVQF